MTGQLFLQLREYSGPAPRWRLELTGQAGELLADHEVRLDVSCWQYEALTDLPGYLSWHAAPDRQAQEEERILATLGEWLGSEVLGPVGTAIARRRPVNVLVTVPPESEAADRLLFLPLEMARVGGRALGLSRISFAWRSAADHDAHGGIGDRLRVLGLFSMPEGGRPLNLRRERRSLMELIRAMSAAGKAVDVRVLQYGVTRGRLREVVGEPEGWDVIHISGHGAPGELLLESPAGQPDRVRATDLAGLLEAARDRLKLVTVATCWSAAPTADEQRRLLGLPVHDPLEDSPERARGTRPGSPSAVPLARELSARLRCAVLAMRYPVDEDFAVAFATGYYELLFSKGLGLPDAVSVALRELAEAERGMSSLSLLSPVLIGGQGAGLRLAAPGRARPESYGTSRLRLAGLPPEPDRFVGRTLVMARASAALASDSGIPGVLLHGMPGGGKTACALELGYGHEHAFDQVVWYKAPDEGMAVNSALTDFALTLERYLDGFQMAHMLTSQERLAAFLPRLTELMERSRVLIVVDNAESLLTGAGQWRDDRWGQVIGALLRHQGRGRLILTSRRPPADWAGSGPAGSAPVIMLAVDALSADEALLLAGELPNLRALISGDLPGIQPEVARRLALGVLTVAQGHPKMLELANGQAAHPQQLAVLVEAGNQAWREQGGLPDGFFTSAGHGAASGDYWHVLASWAGAVTSQLGPGEQDLFSFLCCLEEPDRIRPVLTGNWADLWRRLGRDGQLPDLDRALAAIATAGLAEIRRGSDDAEESYPVHPGVAEAGRARAGQPFRDAVDSETAGYWTAVRRYASGEHGDGVRTGLLVRAGLAAVPYCLRQQQWDVAAFLVDDVFLRDPSRANAAAVLPAIQQITQHDPRAAVVLARVLQVIDPATAEATLRAALADAVSHGDHRIASMAAGRLADLCRDSGRLAEALDLTQQRAEQTRQADLGPWTQIADEVQRLQVLIAMGQADQVLTEAGLLRARMGALPAIHAAGSLVEAIPPWSVREALLDTGRNAAIRLGQWAQALDLNAASIASKRDRQAPATDIAFSRFNDYGPLLRLGRTGEALDLLLDCRQVFQDAHDTEMLGKTLSALADAEDQRGHGDATLRLQRDALRYTYLAGDVPAIAISYHNLGNYLRRHARQPAQALASHLTAALIRILIGFDGGINPVHAAATDLRDLSAAATPPRDVADVCGQLAGIPGTDLPGLIARLSPDPEVAERTLRDLIAQAQDVAAASARELPHSRARLDAERPGSSHDQTLLTPRGPPARPRRLPASVIRAAFVPLSWRYAWTRRMGVTDGTR